MDELGLHQFSYLNNTYTRNGIRYQVTDLIEASKNIEPFDLILKGIDLGVEPWGTVDMKDAAHHFKRVIDASLDYAVILDDCGFICDGWHRVVKAIVEGRKTIKAVRLTVMPQGTAV